MINPAKIPRAYSEVYSFINSLGDSYIKKIPKFIYNKIKSERDVNYIPIYETNKEISDKDISYEGLVLISAINLQYLCDNPLEKEELKKIYINNTSLKKEEFSYDNLFKCTSKKENMTQNALVEYKDGLFTKFINRIKSFFKLEKEKESD